VSNATALCLFTHSIWADDETERLLLGPKGEPRGRCVRPTAASGPRPTECTSRAIVRGDAKCLSIAAASIVAKVVRDTIMVELARDYPAYGFERHKGYGTAQHHAAIERYGVTPHHRRSFKTVQLALGLAEA